MNVEDQEIGPMCLGCSAVEIERNCVEFMGRKYCKTCPVIGGDGSDDDTAQD